MEAQDVPSLSRARYLNGTRKDISERASVKLPPIKKVIRERKVSTR